MDMHTWCRLARDYAVAHEQVQAVDEADRAAQARGATPPERTPLTEQLSAALAVQRAARQAIEDAGGRVEHGTILRIYGPEVGGIRPRIPTR